MIDPAQIDAWRAQLSDEASSFARDLASVLLRELERLQWTDGAGVRRFAATQAALIRAQLATSTECRACGDGALRRAEERMRSSGTVRPHASTVVAAVVR